MSSKKLKFIVWGPDNIGKQCFIQRLCKAQYIPDKPKDSSAIKHITQFCHNGEDVKIKFIPTLEPDPAVVLKLKPHGIILLYSTEDEGSFHECLEFLQSLRNPETEDEDTNKKVSALPGIVLIQTKVDLIEDSPLDHDDVYNKIKENKVRLYRVSSKENYNMVDPINYLINKHLSTLESASRRGSKENQEEPEEDVDSDSDAEKDAKRKKRKPKRKGSSVRRVLKRLGSISK